MRSTKAPETFVALRPVSIFDAHLAPGDIVPQEVIDRLPLRRLTVLQDGGHIATQSAAAAKAADRAKRQWSVPGPDPDAPPRPAAPTLEEAVAELAAGQEHFYDLDDARRMSDHGWHGEAEWRALDTRRDYLKELVAEHRRRDAIAASQAAASEIAEQPPTVEHRLTQIEGTLSRINAYLQSRGMS
jgi:hypothetical protein